MNKYVSKDITRDFAPGSEWVYFKIYCGYSTADKLLVKLVRPLVVEAKLKQSIDRWFFIRYEEQGNHLRLRLHLAQLDHFRSLLESLHELANPFIGQGLIHKLQPETYQREVERYGHATMELSEMIFHHDSEMCLQLVEVLGTEKMYEERWLTGLQAADGLLNDFKYNDERKLELLRRLNLDFGMEFQKDSRLAEQISQKYRVFRDEIEARLYGRSGNVLSNWLNSTIRQRSEKIRPLAAEIISMTSGTEGKSLDDLLGSYIHMMMNRLFRSRQRTMEMVLYDFLFRNYKAKIAKNKYRDWQ